MARLVADTARYLRRHLDGSAHVLLINPPVQERRYHWLRWNQPSELLRLSTWLKKAHPGIDVRLFDFMFPDETGRVSKHKVKETWTGSQDDDQLWHFGKQFDDFQSYLASAASEKWNPNLILVSSLTSYWHVSIEKLLIRLCSHLGKTRRKATRVCLYGNYPQFEPTHAQGQVDADVAFTRRVNTIKCVPDFRLYIGAEQRLPNFFALDIEDPSLVDHLSDSLSLKEEANKKRGLARVPVITTAFFNSDVCSSASRLEDVCAFVEEHPRQVFIEGLVGIEPRSLTSKRLAQIKRAGFRSLFVEHARSSGGGVHSDAYETLLCFLSNEREAKRLGKSRSPLTERGGVTGFVAMGLPDDDMDELVNSTLKLNSYFQSVILKPFGYSPDVDPSAEAERRSRWAEPYKLSPQWFPYVGNGSRLGRSDYANLVRWQNLLNRRVKGFTFDFLDSGHVARLVRETLVTESWKRRQEAR